MATEREKDLMVAAIFAMTGSISVSSRTMSPMTMASLPMGLKATQPPSARVGLIVTPSRVTFRSVRGNP
jgi:hypothetical protein